MTKVKPLKALLFNQEKIPDLSKVVCPPYDVISPERQEYFYNLNPYNLIHILLSKDIPGEDKYKLAGDLFSDWQQNKVLVAQERPAIYAYEQIFKIRGENKSRLGFIGLLRLPDKNSSVFGHENTNLGPKEDRLKLLKSTQANLSPIFAVFQDKRRIISVILKEYIKNKKPIIDIKDEEKNTHRVWKIDDAGILQKVETYMEGENVFIADGHHRFEVSCAYRDQMIKKTQNYSGQEDFNYTLAYFTNTDPHGLCVLPVHRLLTLDRSLQEAELVLLLKEYFDLEEIKEKEKSRFFFLLEKAGRQEHIIGMCKDSKRWLLRLRNIRILDKVMPDKPTEYRQLDVSIFNQMVLNSLTNIQKEIKITYTHNADEVLEAVAGSVSSIGFLLNPAKIEQIISVALSGEKMPPKSTYFYPKVLSGLVINKHSQV